MKVSLKLKFILSYLLILGITLALLNTLGHSILYHHLLDRERVKLYEEAQLITKDYITSIRILDTSEHTTLRTHFSSLQTLTDMRVWIVSASGTILMDSSTDASCEEENINQYDSSFLTNQFTVGAYPEGLMADQTLSVIYPITESLSTTGYVVLMSPLSNLEENATSCTDSILICSLLTAVPLGLLLFYLYWQSVGPLKKMICASREYAEGHFNYPMPKASHPQKELADAISYLAAQLNGMTEYQKNFIANVSHDFRSPLTSIRGYAQALSDGTIPPEMQEKYFNIIIFETERLTKLTGNLLELNRLDHGYLVLEKTDFDINDAIKKTSETFEQQCMSKKILLELIFEEKELFVHGDLNHIQQVIQNLLDNAIKFSPNNAVIHIHTQRKSHKAFISVKDHGIGIPKDSISKIWSRFYKTDSSRGKDKTGTGLGLSITKEIIDAHGENINVISTEGVGTEFIFSLPIASPAEK